MFGPKFGEKCIIMHFLVVEKEGKRPQRRGAEKRLEEDQIRENHPANRACRQEQHLSPLFA
jgi:hypothetical protein